MPHWISKQESLPDGALKFHALADEEFGNLETARERAVALSRRHPGQVFIVNDGTGRIFKAVNGDGDDGAP